MFYGNEVVKVTKRDNGHIFGVAIVHHRFFPYSIYFHDGKTALLSVMKPSPTTLVTSHIIRKVTGFLVVQPSFIKHSIATTWLAGTTTE